MASPVLRCALALAEKKKAGRRGRCRRGNLRHSRNSAATTRDERGGTAGERGEGRREKTKSRRKAGRKRTRRARKQEQKKTLILSFIASEKNKQPRKHVQRHSGETRHDKAQKRTKRQRKRKREITGEGVHSTSNTEVNQRKSTKKKKRRQGSAVQVNDALVFFFFFSVVKRDRPRGERPSIAGGRGRVFFFLCELRYQYYAAQKGVECRHSLTLTHTHASTRKHAHTGHVITRQGCAVGPGEM